MYECPILENIGTMCSEMVEEKENQILVSVKQTIGYDINKEELVRALNYDRDQYQKGYEDGLNANRWILCDERLPEEEGWYLVTEVDNSYIDVNMRLWVKEGWIMPQSIDGKIKIVAWQPLPEPWKDGE